MAITRETMKDFRIDFQEAMKALEQKYNVKVSLGNISYSDAEFRSKVIGLSKDPVAQEKKDAKVNPRLNLMAKQKGISFDGNFVGSMYKVKGRTMMVQDYSSKSYKYPIKALCSEDGKTYKLSWVSLQTATLI